MPLILLVSCLINMGNGCHRAPPPTPPVAKVPGASIMDCNRYSWPQLGNTTILKIELPPGSEYRIADLCRLAEDIFPTGEWSNCGPDASFRQITLVTASKTYKLQSWHPLCEINADIVAGSYGLTTLHGMSREQFLQRDNPAYVRRRETFDKIEAELRRRFGGIR